MSKALICPTCRYSDSCPFTTREKGTPVIDPSEGIEGRGVTQKIKCIRGQAHWTKTEKGEAIEELEEKYGYLFTAEKNAKSIMNDLNEERISDELEVNFKENDRKLSKDAKVSAKEKCVWRIKDYEPEERHYCVKKEGEKLNVYECGSAELGGGTR